DLALVENRLPDDPPENAQTPAAPSDWARLDLPPFRRAAEPAAVGTHDIQWLATFLIAAAAHRPAAGRQVTDRSPAVPVTVGSPPRSALEQHLERQLALAA